MAKTSALIPIVKERYHTAEEFDGLGLKPVQDHIIGYLEGRRTIPVSRTYINLRSVSGGLSFTFSNVLLEMFLRQPSKIIKPYEAALKYGFRGNSRGGINGIFNQRKEDLKMSRKTDRLIASLSEIIEEDLQTSDFDKLRKVKIVYHNPSGERVVGVYNPDLSRVLFLGFVNY